MQSRRLASRVDATPFHSRKLWLLTMIGLAICFGLPELDLGAQLSDRDAGIPWPRDLVWWTIAVVLLLYVRLVERRPLASIGLHRPTGKTFVFGIATAVVLFASVILFFAIVFPMLGLSIDQKAVERITRLPQWYQVLLAIRAAVVEEILYRGYPISRIAQVTGSKSIAAIVSLAVFTLAHLSYWGPAQRLIVVTGAIVLTLLYLWRRDLVSNMIAHVLVDLAGFVAASAPS